MTPLDDVRTVPASPAVPASRGLLRLVCTSNPFYVLSAGLFLLGLWISFGGQVEAASTWALMSGMAGYTLLLAVTACLLVRFANVWDDVRTVLLLVALMFLATSVTFDEVLVLDPERGYICYLGGLVFAILVSEAVLRGIRLVLPAAYRVPYYLILAVFFLYPVALRPLLNDPRGEALSWGLFGFSSLAGVAFLTLLPAIRAGAGCVRDNGSPWPWPLYPWALFVFLGFAVPGRAFLLCWSMHLLGGAERDQLLFGPFFLVPFGLALAVLLLEMGLVSGRRGVVAAALSLPACLISLAAVGHRNDAIYQGFQLAFAARLGGDPLYLTVLAVAGFSIYAACRRAPLAFEAVTASLVALAFVTPHTLTTGVLRTARLEPLLAAAAIQLALGLWRDNTARCLLGTLGLAVAVAFALPESRDTTGLRGIIAFHLALLAMLLVGWAFDDALARGLRGVAAGLVLLVCWAVPAGGFHIPASVPAWIVDAYPLLMASLLAGYGLLLGHRPSVVIALLVLTCWLIALGLWSYLSLRRLVVGLDYLVLSLSLFVVAVLTSLVKAGVLGRVTSRPPDPTAPAAE